LREESRWKVLLAKLQAQIEKYERHFNKALRSELIAMQEEEQASRKIWLEMEEKHGAGSGSADSMLILTKEIDKKNTARLKELIATYGFPKADSVGSEGVFAAFLIVQHSPDPEFQKECLPHLLEAAGKKEIKFSQVALLHDRILMKEGKKQLYGTQVVTNKKTGKKELYPIEDEANVNERREEAGLTPLENYLKKFGINYVPKE
jgi:hypothetical protein